MFRTMIFETVTGAPQLEVKSAGADWSSKLDGSGTVEITIKIRESNIPRGTARDLLQDNARMIAIVDEYDTVIAAGVILRTRYHRPTGRLIVQCVDIREVFRQRLPYGVLVWNSAGSLTVTDRTYAGVVRAALYRGMGSGENPAWELPINLPPDEGPGSFTKTWHYYDFTIIDDILRELEDEGVEIFFDPYLSSGNLRFRTRVGKPYAGDSIIELPVVAPESRVGDLEVTIDGAKRLTGVIYAGTGSEADTKVAGAGHGPYNIPIRDAFRSAKDVKSTAQLQRIADADLAEHFDYIVQRSYTVRLGDPVFAAQLKPGNFIRMDIQGDEWLADLRTTQRILSVSGGLDETVRVESQSYG